MTPLANGSIQTQTVQSQVRGTLGQQQQQQTPNAQQIQLGAQPQQFVTLGGGQQVAVRMQPQVMQFPQATAQQTMVPVHFLLNKMASS